MTCLIFCEEYKPDGLLFTGSVDRTIRVWNPSGTNKSQLCVQKLDAHGSTVSALSHNEKMLLSCGNDHTMRIWKPAPGRDLLLFPTGNKAAFENYNKTVENFYMNNDLKDVVAKENFTILSEPNENNGYWGVNTSVTVMNKIITPCYGIFFKDKKGFKLAKIRNKFIDVNLSSMFWEKLSNEAFKYMFQIESTADINLKQDEFNHLVNWSEKNGH